MMKKRKTKAQKKKKGKRGVKPATESPLTWVEQCLDWLPLEDGTVEANSEQRADDSAGTVPSNNEAASNDDETRHGRDHDISVVSWNVLAESYCNQTSHSRLPMKFQQLVFDRPKRRDHVRRRLQHMATNLVPDVFALQEVDPPLEIKEHLKSLGYEGIETPTSVGGRDGRVDACGLYYKDELWSCTEHEIINLDDLVTMDSSIKTATTETIAPAESKGKGKNQRNFRVNGNLQGLQSSFRRRNMALLARLQNKQTRRKVTCLAVHLFWNPAYEYVKLCQAHYILQRAADFCHDQSPLIMCGDFNSMPGSFVHRYMVEGSINARLSAPWNCMSKNTTSTIADMNEQMADLQISKPQEETKENSELEQDNDEDPQVRYLLDFTLNKLCRWLRILGIDAALETDEEEKMRTKQGKIHIFSRCKFERRVLVTTSTRLLHRKDCPPGAYLLTTKSLSNLEMTLPHLLTSHGVTLDPEKFLSRCVVCNGFIQAVKDAKKVEEIFSQHGAPVDQATMDIFQCAGCGQGYWWNDEPMSSASRVKNQATKLLEECIRGGVKLKQETDLGLFDFIDVKLLRNERKDAPSINRAAGIVGPSLQVIHWLHNESLSNPFGTGLDSSYASSNNRTKEDLVFTNVTSDFTGLLDYIFYQPTKMKLTKRLYVPKTFDELNCQQIPRGHLLPSNVWPSDHLAIGACFSFPDSDGKAPKKVKMDEIPFFCAPIGSAAPVNVMLPIPKPRPPPAHNTKCKCGCVPNILSLFEMAELRKQARAKARRNKA